MRSRVLAVMIIAGALLGNVRPAQALTAEEVRGGWVADLNGQRHIYVLNVRGVDIKGIYCWDCSNPDNLAFVQNGKLEADSISFVVFHDIGPGAPYRENVRGRLLNGQLVLTATRSTGNARPVETTFQRESRRPTGPGGAVPLPGTAPAAASPPRGPVPAAAAPGGGGGGGGRGRGYVPPGPNEPMSVAKISGVWVGGGNGPNKQYFMFRQVENQILGMVCGPCNNPFTFGVLNNGVIMGETFTFNIVHEDWGFGIENGPFNNMATVTIAKNEFRMRTQQDNSPPGVNALEMILTGPLRLDSSNGK